MDENGLPIMGAGVDYLSVEAINQRKLINYLNSFFVSTASFMTSFASKCETRLTQLSCRLGKIETSLRLIEEKLNSIPEVKDLVLENTPAPKTEQISQQPELQSTQTLPQQQTSDTNLPPPPPPAEPIKEIITVSKDQRFIKYFKMLNMGVPETAVKLKMKSEGLDPNLLDTPDAPAPEPDIVNEEGEEESDSDADN